MSDPKKFKNHYIISAFSKSLNKRQEQHLTTEMEMRKRCADLNTAKTRAKSYANSLNETNMLNVADWIPMLHLQTETQRLIINLD